MPTTKTVAKKAVATKPVPRKPVTKKPPSRKTASEKPVPRSTPAKAEHWELRLYVAGETPRSVEAFARLTRICDEHLHGRYSIEVIDLVKSPTLAVGDQIIAIPTVVRRLPAPMKKIIGDLSDMERVIVGLDLTRSTTSRPKKTASPSSTTAT